MVCSYPNNFEDLYEESHFEVWLDSWIEVWCLMIRKYDTLTDCSRISMG